MIIQDGLRQRKRRQTREAIHRAAVNQALERTPDGTTVAEISAEAGVSTRTFFNYFPCKEDAILGFHEELPSTEELDAFAASDGEDLFEEVVFLLKDVLSAPTTSTTLMADRRALITGHPGLTLRQMSRVYAVEMRVAGAVAERMRRCERYHAVADTDAAARMLVTLATSVIRTAIRTSTETQTVPRDDADDERLLDTTIRTLKEIAGTIR